MALIEWRGDAPAVAQVNHFTPASVGAGNTFTITINGKAITYTAAAGAVQDVCDGLTPLLQASLYPEFQEVTWTEDNAKIIGTSNTPGRPFTATSSASGGTATFVKSTSVASSGPNDWSTASNWSGGAVPGGSDTVVVYPGKPDILYGLDQSGAGTITSITWMQNARSRLGLPSQNSGGYTEYRTTHLNINVGAIYVGFQNTENRGGTPRFKINTLTGNCIMVVAFCGQPEANEIAVVDWIGDHASNLIQVLYGSVALGVNGASKIGTLRVGDTGAQANTNVIVGSRVTQFGTLTQTGGKVTALFQPTTWTQTGGTSVLNASGTVTTCNLSNGLLYIDNAPTITNMKLKTGGVLDCSRISAGPTFTNTTIYSGTQLYDPRGSITFTNPALLSGCSIKDVRLDLGNDRSVQVS